jgi:bZIP-type transcription factor MBZ1
MEDNTRLTDLTRMLLSSSAFSGILSELSTSGMREPSSAASNQEGQVNSQSRPSRKDVNPHHATRQMQNQQPQINMAMIAETSIDFSTLEQPSNSWNAIPSNNFQVISVSALPGNSTRACFRWDFHISNPTESRA